MAAPPRVGVSTADRNYLPSLVFCVVRSVAARPLRARRSLLFASTSQPNTPPPGERLGRGRPPPRRLTLSSGPFFRRAPRRTERDGLATRGSGHNFSSAGPRALFCAQMWKHTQTDDETRGSEMPRDTEAGDPGRSNKRDLGRGQRRRATGETSRVSARHTQSNRHTTHSH